MIKQITFFAIISTSLFASEYYAKLNPINTYEVQSAVSGQVVFVNNEIKSKNAQNTRVVQINANVDSQELKQSQIKLKNLQEVLKIEEGTLKSFNRVSSKSKFDKDNQKIKILDISSSISDLKTKISILQETIKNKNLVEEKNYIYNIAVEVGDYVNPGSMLYSSMDLSAGKLEIFIPIDQANDIKEKTIYLDGNETDLKISKLYQIADSTHISSYKCEIIVPDPKAFSSLMKIEFK